MYKPQDLYTNVYWIVKDARTRKEVNRFYTAEEASLCQAQRSRDGQSTVIRKELA